MAQAARAGESMMGLYPLHARSMFAWQGGELPKHYYGMMDPFVTLTAAAAATKKRAVGRANTILQKEHG